MATFPANPRGIPTAIIDPRGVKTTVLINELDQEVKTVNAAAVDARTGSEGGLSSFSYEELKMYDAITSSNRAWKTRIRSNQTTI